MDKKKFAKNSTKIFLFVSQYKHFFSSLLVEFQIKLRKLCYTGHLSHINPLTFQPYFNRAVPIEKLCELNGTEVIPDDYKSDCYNDVDESKFACKEKYRIMVTIVMSIR